MKKILVLEDNEANMYLITFILKNKAYDVIEARSGEEGVEMAEKEKPDLIIMDIQLPGANGLEITKEIKRVYNEIVIVILASNGLQEHRQQAYRNGADYFISKDDDYCMEGILTRVDVALAGLAISDQKPA